MERFPGSIHSTLSLASNLYKCNPLRLTKYREIINTHLKDIIRYCRFIERSHTTSVPGILRVLSNISVTKLQIQGYLSTFITPISLCTDLKQDFCKTSGRQLNSTI